MVQEPDKRKPSEPQYPPRFKTVTGGVTLQEAPPRRTKFPSVMSQLDEIDKKQKEEEDFASKRQAAQVLREVEAELKVERSVEERQRIEAEAKKKKIAEERERSVVDETFGDEAVSDRYTSEDKAVTIGAVVTERGRNRGEPLQKKRPAPSPSLKVAPVPMPEKKAKTGDVKIRDETPKDVRQEMTQILEEKEKTPKEPGDGSPSKTAEPLHRSPEGELEKKAEGKPPEAPEQRVKEVKATEVQQHAKRVMDTVEPVPERRSQYKED